MDYSKYKTLTVEVTDGLATVTLNCPDRLNAISSYGPGVSHREFEDVWLDIAVDENVRVVILTGAGRAFSAGGSITSMKERLGTELGWKLATKAVSSAPRLIWNLLSVPQPIISAVNGDAMGLGATVALFSDTAIMADTARIGDTHVRVGIVAGDGGTAIWPLLVGAMRAKEFLMRAKVIDGKEAERIGLVSYSVPTAEVMPKAREIAADLLSLPPLAVRWTKASVNQTLRDAFTRTMDGGMAYEALTMMSRDHEEAVNSFLEKRKPSGYRGF